MNNYFFLFLIPFSIFGQDEATFSKEIGKIAFGSCSKQNMTDKQLWKEVSTTSPDLWVWMGDNIYSDTENMKKMKSDYQLQKSHPDYQKLIKTTQIIGIWDDHDYGVNDGGKEYPKKEESRDLLFHFLEVEKNHPAWKRDGAYQSYTFREKGSNLKIILLDTRYFRDPLKKVNHVNVQNPNGQILGADQWLWLENQLSDKTIDAFLLVSSIQVISSEHQWEKWSNFPSEKEKLFSLIKEQVKVPLLILSGDRHVGEISEITVEGYPFSLYEITSSSLTSPWGSKKEESNENRVLGLIYEPHFAFLSIDWKKMIFDIRFIGQENSNLSQYRISYH